ncbi:hypothetical protein LFT44_09485 [Arthrobacter sp. FW306-05-C]|uniref:hypothetical protein n=1 Tax=unclassified Arthrobacter TaxID=235627 RepID=UPI001EF0E13F|nr:MULTISPECIES: hypothetical protein [unclassified Arthrobacter]UKA68591.1 hypothetical protein LFT44_09485 [Arthrobacter sp. FW306-05-C]UKA77226.1 hypothetical protein LFT46_09485 [Arthrobacter sp. FW306-07-I]
MPAASTMRNIPEESMLTTTGTVLAPLIMLFRQYNRDFIGVTQTCGGVVMTTA